jgi:hypothetical protein
MLKTADPDKAATNLEFLLKAGLTTNEARRKDLAAFLKERDPGQGPVLSLDASLIPSFSLGHEGLGWP